MNRTRIIAISVAIVIVSSLFLVAFPYFYGPTTPPTGTSSTLEMKRVRYGQFGVETSAIQTSAVRLAMDLGYFQKEGLLLDYVGIQSSPLMLQAMAAGELDMVSIGTLEAALRLAATGALPHKIFLSFAPPGGGNTAIIVGRKEIASVQDLKGKTIAHGSPGDSIQILVKSFLRSSGMDPDKDVAWVALGAPPARVTALRAGKVDAITTTIQTWATIQDDQNLRVIVNSEAFGRFVTPYIGAYIVTQKLIDKDPDVVKRFTKAVIKVTRLFKENKTAWIDAIIIRRPEMTREQLSAIYDQLQWAVNGGINVEKFRESIEQSYGSPDLKGVPPISVSNYVTTEFVDAALKELGIYKDLDDPGRAIQGLAIQPVFYRKAGE
ncbi:MAG: NrtA/SsuA/CpmA family ABC transporter substrate-binding protein [Thaumarchaeota archaeon]|nr:NrtA/SsuA/CpmA family ABC transporter substrate-binding protein [Nitrososphaerota archaeon]